MRQYEHSEQVAFFDYVRHKAKTDDRYKLIYAIPNGSKRNIITAKKLKDEGVKAGVPDIAVDVAMNGYHGLKIEMKARRCVIVMRKLKTKIETLEGKLTEKQKEHLNLLEKYGYKTAVCYNAGEAIKELEEYLNG